MKKLFSVTGGFMFLFCMMTEAAVAGQAFESLLAAAGSDGATLTVVFDGAAPASAAGMRPEFSQPGYVSAAGAGNGRPQQGLFIVPVPELVAIEGVNLESKRISLPTEIMNEKAELPFMNKGIAALEATASGKPLAEFFKSEGVVIKWDMKGDFTTESPYARACAPEVCVGKKVIYIPKRDKDKENFGEGGCRGRL